MAAKSAKLASRVRHLAYQIVAQLPEDTAEALLVIEYAKQVLLHPIEDEADPVPLKLVDIKDGDA